MFYQKVFFKNFHGIVKHFIFSLPDISIGFRLREMILRKQGAIVGRNTKIFSGVTVNKPGNVTIGNNVSINKGSIINASGTTRIHIGNDVLIGPYTVLRSDDHVFSDLDLPIRLQGHSGADISIGENCWIGAHVVVLKGVAIGPGTVVGASSLVAKSLPEFSIAIGTPAKVIRNRKIDQAGK